MHYDFYVCADFLYTLFLRRYKAISAITDKDLPINDEIRAKEVRMIDENGGQLGLMSLSDAKDYAYSRDLDLVMMAANATPPVCKAMNYGKYCFDKIKKEKEARKNQQTAKVKEIQLSCRIDVHDFETRLNQAIKFLQGGDKVRAIVRFKGREMAHMEIGYAMVQKFVDACQDYGIADKKPVMDGRIVSVLLSPVKNK